MPYLTGVLTPQDYGAAGNGTTDDTTALQSAISAAAASGGTVFCPPGSTYKISTALVPVSGVRITGASYTASQIVSTASSVFSMGPVPLLDNVEIDHLTLQVTGSDLFTGANITRSSVHDCHLIQNSAGFAIWNAPTTALLSECRFLGNREDVYGATRSIAAWRLNSASNSTQVSQNVWAGNVCFNNGADATQYWYQISSSGAASFNQACSFRNIVFGNPLGGMIDLQSHVRGHIESCLAYDTTANIAQSLVSLRKNLGSSIGTRGTTVINSGRAATSETLAAGVYDIACDSNCEETVIISPVRSAQINAGGSTGFKLIGQGGTTAIANGAASAAAGANAGTSPPAPVSTAGPANESGLITFGTGTAPAAGAMVVVTFGTPFSVTPRVQLTETTTALAALSPVVSATSATSFTVSVTSAPAASQGNTVYGFNWAASA